VIGSKSRSRSNAASASMNCCVMVVSSVKPRSSAPSRCRHRSSSSTATRPMRVSVHVACQHATAGIIPDSVLPSLSAIGPGTSLADPRSECSGGLNYGGSCSRLPSGGQPNRG
jgi:hypothetical protein